ncbi:aromatic aminoacid transaminase [Xylona heveae TC161]|uniref:Aromatic aminoacid transaminase n=1 Tax=Xylona heveae (strain CBS 132557 / TC161) TaxID=1328760 RepID=A0A164ZGT4_XYLHT|nr:aromatic aminoacid transaminase [Xylona heveae TC161]KZF19087.1 aromatic aminoacid transaminase [Xylona heveae TC161]
MPRLGTGDVESLRAHSVPIPSNIDPCASSDWFKSAHAKSRPTSKDLSHHFSIESRSLVGSAIKAFANQHKTSKIIALGEGRPVPEYYPWEHLSFRGISSSLNNIEAGSKDEGALQSVAKQGDSYNISSALNYGHAVGSSYLVRFLTEHVEMVHDPPYADWKVCLSCGSTSALELALRIFCNRGDTVLTEQYTYSTAIEAATLVGLRVQGVSMDPEGLRPDCLDEILRTWDPSRGPKPRLLYSIPTGQNPTGTTQSAGRRQAIYQLAEEHDLIIVEDDPYYYLQLGPYLDRPSTRDNTEELKLDETFINPSQVPSYLSIDRSGRVVRLDSTSKILAPGLRTGWVTASSAIIEKFVCYNDVCVGGVNGPSQLMLWTLLDRSWGHSGFLTWLENLSKDYCSRRNIILQACDRYFPKDICHWTPPEFGMFLWINLDLAKHPVHRSATSLGGDHSQQAEIEERIQSNALKNGVKVAKGSLFSADRRYDGKLQFRITYAAASKGDLDEGVRGLSNAIRKEFSLSPI